MNIDCQIIKCLLGSKHALIRDYITIEGFRNRQTLRIVYVNLNVPGRNFRNSFSRSIKNRFKRWLFHGQSILNFIGIVNWFNNKFWNLLYVIILFSSFWSTSNLQRLAIIRSKVKLLVKIDICFRL